MKRAENQLDAKQVLSGTAVVSSKSCNVFPSLVSTKSIHYSFSP